MMRVGIAPFCSALPGRIGSLVDMAIVALTIIQRDDTLIPFWNNKNNVSSLVVLYPAPLVQASVWQVLKVISS
jgi:hypothetical protein